MKIDGHFNLSFSLLLKSLKEDNTSATQHSHRQTNNASFIVTKRITDVTSSSWEEHWGCYDYYSTNEVVKRRKSNGYRHDRHHPNIVYKSISVNHLCCLFHCSNVFPDSSFETSSSSSYPTSCLLIIIVILFILKHPCLSRYLCFPRNEWKPCLHIREGNLKNHKTGWHLLRQTRIHVSWTTIRSSSFIDYIDSNLVATDIK